MDTPDLLSDTAKDTKNIPTPIAKILPLPHHLFDKGMHSDHKEIKDGETFIHKDKQRNMS